MRKVSIVLLLAVLAVGCQKRTGGSVYTGVLEGKSVRVPALTGGKIVDLRAAEGQEVRAGDTLAVIDTTDLVLQLKQLQAAREELAVQETISNTNLQRTKSDLEYAQERYDRTRALFEKQAVPQQSLDDLSNALDRAKSAYQAARQQQRVLVAKRKQVQAQIDALRKKLTDAVVTAPTDGLVATLYYELGEAIPPLQPIVELVHIRELKVKIYISEEALPQVKHGQQVRIRVDGLDEDLTGRVSWVSPKAEFTPKAILTPKTRTSLVYAVEVTVPNPKRILKHGMPVEVVL